jgi:hypothetical protein
MIFPEIIGKKLDWETDEHRFTKKIKRMSESLYNYTELEFDDMTEAELRGLLRSCSSDLDLIMAEIDIKLNDLQSRTE